MDTPDLDKPDFDQVIDYGFIIRGAVHYTAEESDDPAELLDHLRELADDDPRGLACALFAEVINQERDKDGDAADAPKLAVFYWDWKSRLDVRSDPDLDKG